jgi:hypothetical protein
MRVSLLRGLGDRLKGFRDVKAEIWLLMKRGCLFQIMERKRIRIRKYRVIQIGDDAKIAKSKAFCLLQNGGFSIFARGLL